MEICKRNSRRTFWKKRKHVRETIKKMWEENFGRDSGRKKTWKENLEK
jgi:hypothetical protein